ncbi:inositol monophosphatase family protein [Spectribacter hydrogenoxidans]|uniref:Inositol-1-monophosphatase n=1 Tax=Spectribacter hydrogenoxidans TaxID=3075608 RepID=A0ABU3BYG4_9GAMM|nr:inositol monophosphatase family protein [Salinisphaera sp. W335]MDT0634361.1 inositol monophosphatase family protein [Salinisphaera sp. W335]
MDPLANIAVSAARAAGNICMRHLRQGRGFDVREKGRNDFVTEVDHQAEVAIIDTIRRAYPDHAILAEESGHSPARRQADVEWIIDPIDGTTNFIHGIPHFAVSIACRVGGQLAHGVIFDPYKDELFVASRGRGAMLDGRRIRVSQCHQLGPALLATGFAYHRQTGMAKYFPAFESLLNKCGDIRRGGSAALDLAWVAAGRLDGFWEFGLQPWDMAAGVILVIEAGGMATSLGDGDPLETGDVVSGAPKLQPMLRATIEHALK